MLPTDWEYGGWPASGEIDIMEHVGYDPNVIHGTVHTADFNHLKNTQKGSSTKLDDVFDEFHVYSAEWTEDRIDFFVDGTKYYTFYKESDDYKKWPFDKRFHLILNIAIGGNWGGVEGVDDDIFPTEMVVDYVRVYQSFDNVEITGPTVVTENQEALDFSCTYIPNVEYEWELPDGATIVEGEGTHEIKVNWGTAEGNVSVKTVDDTGCGDLQGDLQVYISFSPDVSKLLISDFNGNGAAKMQDNENINVSIEDGIGTISIDEEGRRLSFEFDRPYNITDLALLKVAFYGQGANTNFATIFIVDEEGEQTKIHQLELESYGQDNLLHVGFDFTGATMEVEMRRIEKLVIRIDDASMPLIIDEIAFYSTQEAPESPQNPLVIKKGDKYFLWWEDSETALNYDVIFSPEDNDEDTYVIQSNVYGNQIPVEIRFTSVRKYYTITAKNDGGVSKPSKSVTVESVGIDKPKANDYYSLAGHTIELKNDNLELILYSLDGKKLASYKSQRLIDLGEYQGVFIISITNGNELLTDKINLF
jgi:hypothetical protein